MFARRPSARLATIAFVLASLASATAHAEAPAAATDPSELPEPPPPKKTLGAFELGLRLGVALPLGRYMGDQHALYGFTVEPDFTRYQRAQIPITLDLGYRWGHFYAGIDGSYGIVVLDVPDCAECKAQVFRVGVQAQAHWRALGERGFDPWIGLGTGYEVDHLSFAGGDVEGADDYAGFEIANLQVGVDLLTTSHVRVGPYLTWTLDEFTTLPRALEPRSNGGSNDGPAPSQALHSWFFLGVRGALDI